VQEVLVTIVDDFVLACLEQFFGSTPEANQRLRLAVDFTLEDGRLSL
jgi:hypothetical protein